MHPQKESLTGKSLQKQSDEVDSDQTNGNVLHILSIKKNLKKNFPPIKHCR